MPAFPFDQRDGFIWTTGIGRLEGSKASCAFRRSGLLLLRFRGRARLWRHFQIRRTLGVVQNLGAELLISKAFLIPVVELDKAKQLVVDKNNLLNCDNVDPIAGRGSELMAVAAQN